MAPTDLEALRVSEGMLAILLHRLTTLPAAAFPHTTHQAAELTAGTPHDRFDFTVRLMIDGLAQSDPHSIPSHIKGTGADARQG
ncbi:hypothetical protein ACF06D_17960 [Streptomyces griseoluteus]|uniref:hypothetical protein n=1 Tax=Streptomyces griseoluteus TaxID=29306 RepID=UPI003702BB9A